MKYPFSDHYDGKVFFNQDPNARSIRGLNDLYKWKSSGQTKKWPPYRDGRAKAKLASSELGAGQAVVTFINHASALVQVRGANLLTDPVFSERVSPLSWIGPKRAREAGLKISELPNIDYILLSHNHYDHLDIGALKELRDRFNPKLICPLGNEEFFRAKKFTQVVEIDWWQKLELLKDLNVNLTPAQHWSSRSPFDRNKSLWGGFVIDSNSLKIFFAGDTGYSTHFKQIFEKFGAMDFSLLPIGSYEPRWFMSDQHVNPHEAVKAHVDLHSKKSMGIHFGTFQLTDEGIDAPARDLKTALNEFGVLEENFLVPENGESFAFQK